MRYVALDPGKVTGIVVADVYNSLTSQPVLQLQDEVHVDGIYDWINEWLDDLSGYDRLVVICENYTMNAGAKSSQPDALHIIGALTYLSNQRGFPLILQPPSHKKFADNSKLKFLGLYDTSKGGHKNDAMRHFIYYMIFTEKNRYFMDAVAKMSTSFEPVTEPIFMKGVEPIITGQSYSAMQTINDPYCPPNMAYGINQNMMWGQPSCDCVVCRSSWTSYNNPNPHLITLEDIDKAMKAALPGMQAALNEPNILFEKLKKLK